MFGRYLSSKKLTVLLFVSILVLFVFHAIHYNFIADDAFITLRYARNLAHGYGLVFNLGEHVEGFSSLLWVLITSVPEFLNQDQLMIARFMGLIFSLLTLIISYQIFNYLSKKENISYFGLLVPLVIASNGSFATWSISGMETPLYCLVILSLIFSIIRNLIFYECVLMILCLLVRPEGLIIFFTGTLFKTYTIFRLRKSKNLRYKKKYFIDYLAWLSTGLLTLVILTLFRYFYFNDFLPNTFYAKTGAGIAQLVEGLNYFIHYTSDHEGLLFTLLPIIIFLLIGSLKERFIALNALLLWSATIWVGGDGLPMYRFALPALPLVTILQVLLMKNCYVLIKSIYPKRRTVLKFIFVIASAIWLGLSFSPPIIGAYYGNYLYQKEVEIPRWTRVGLWFKENAKPHESIAVVPIGAIGYYSELKIYDMLGLTDKHIARRKMPNPQLQASMPGHGKYDGQYILSRKPTYLLLGNVDVTEVPRNPNNIPFIPYYSSAIYERERDMYDTDTIFERYRPRSVLIAPNEYLNFYELKPEYRQ